MTTDATVDLKAALKEKLQSRGVWEELKSRMRMELHQHLTDEPHEGRPPLSHENLLINELIREYLDYNNYKSTSSTLVIESCQPKEPLDRQFLSRELNICSEQTSGGKPIPLLYGILNFLMKGRPHGLVDKEAHMSGERGHKEQSQARPSCAEGSLEQPPLVLVEDGIVKTTRN